MLIRDLMHRDVVTVKESDSLAWALELMSWNGIRHLPVMEGDRLVGILSERDVLAYVNAGARWHVEGSVGFVMTKPVRTVPPTLEVNEAAAMMVAERIDSLPVIETGRLVGIVTSTDILGKVALSVVPRRAEPTVGQLMIRNVQAVFGDDLLGDAAARMAQHGIRHLPVIDGNLCVVGMLSERDVREVTGKSLLEVHDAERSAYVQRLKVEDVMTKDPRTITEEAAVAAAVRALVEDRIGALPVVDEEEHLLGILSYVDLLRFLGARLAADVS